MTAYDNKSYLPYLNNLVKNKIILPIILLIKILLMLSILPLLKNLKPILKLLSLKLMIESELLKIIIFLVKILLKIGQEKYILSILCWKLIHWFIKLKF